MVERNLEKGTTHPNEFWQGVWQPFRHLGQQVAQAFSPNSEASEDQDSYLIEVELPGVAEDDIEVSIREDTLIVRGEKRDQREESGKNYFFSERSYGAFQRAFRLPRDVDKNRIEASHTNGVLKLTLNRKSEPEAKEKKIKISTK